MNIINELDLKVGDNVIYINDNGDRVHGKVVDATQSPSFQVIRYEDNQSDVITDKQVIHYRREFPEGGIA